MISNPEGVLSIAELEAAATKKLPTVARNYFNSGATNQNTVRENSTAYAKYRLRPRVLRDVSNVSTETEVLGSKISFPLCISPAGIQAMADPVGELGTSRACAKKKINMAISSFANHSQEEIIAAGKEISGGHGISYGMQVYTMRDRNMQAAIISRAEAAGCKAIFLTADSPILGLRYHEHRSDFQFPSGLDFPIVEDAWKHVQGGTHTDRFTVFNSDSHSWAREIPWLRSITKMEIWIKGVLTAEDVELAIEYGCDGVLVSNHGGRQLDETPATIDVLPECAEAARGRIRLHVDGGIRSGTDIFKAIALGAECCWVGRPTIWGLAYNGQEGVELMLDILYEEFKRCMQLTGCTSIRDITPARLGIARLDGPLLRL